MIFLAAIYDVSVADDDALLTWTVDYEGIQVVRPTRLGQETGIMSLSAGLRIVG